MQELGKYILAIGVILTLLGALLWLLGDRLSWFGNLPGDIRVERKNFSFYMPLTSMILLSIALSFLFWLFQKFFR